MSSLRDRIKGAISRVRPGRGQVPPATPDSEAVISALKADAAVEPPVAATARGRQTLLSQLNEVPIGGTDSMQFSQFLMSPIAAALAGAVLLVGGIAGVSAATGGPDVTEPVRDAVGAGDNGHGDDSDGGVSEDDRDNVDDNSGAESPSTPFATPDSSDDNSGHGNSDDGDDDQSGPGGGGDDDGSPESPGATPDDDDEEGRSPSSPEATPDDDSEDPPETPEPTQTAEPGDDDGGHSGSGGADGNSGPGS